MKLIARQNIIGVQTDEGLKALDGYMEFSANVKTADELIEKFESDNPTFNADTYEII